MPPPNPAPTPRSAALPFIFITAVLDVLGFGLLIPVGPRLVQQLQGGNEEQAAPIVAALAATFSLMLFLAAPVLGALSDSLGRRPLILISLLGSGIDYLAHAVVQSIGWLFAVRVINGVSGASYSVANAYVADITPPEKRAHAFGLMGAAFGVGFTFGPLIGGLLGEHNIRWPFIAAGILTLINWLYGMFVLPESLPRERRRPLSWRRANPFAVFKHIGRYPLVLGLAIALGILGVAQVSLHVTWVLYTSYRYHWGPTAVAFSLFAVGITSIIVQGGLAGRIVHALGEKRSLLIGIGIAFLAFIGYASATRGWMIYPVIVVGAFAGIAQPAAQSLITRTVRSDEQGETQGALTGIQSIASILGPLIGGNVFAYFISARTPVFRGEGGLPGAPFYLSALLTVLAWIIVAATLRKYGRPSAQA